MITIMGHVLSMDPDLIEKDATECLVNCINKQQGASHAYGKQVHLVHADHEPTVFIPTAYRPQINLFTITIPWSATARPSCSDFSGRGTAVEEMAISNYMPPRGGGGWGGGGGGGSPM